MSVLVYVKPVCENTDGTYEYDFFFSETPDFVWGPFWDMDNPSTNGDITPEESTYSEVKRVITDLPLTTLEETTCYSMEYATVGVLALAWINIENLDEYPANGRMALHFGTPMEEVANQLSKHGYGFKEKSTEYEKT